MLEQKIKSEKQAVNNIFPYFYGRNVTMGLHFLALSKVLVQRDLYKLRVVEKKST